MVDRVKCASCGAEGCSDGTIHCHSCFVAERTEKQPNELLRALAVALFGELYDNWSGPHDCNGLMASARRILDIAEGMPLDSKSSLCVLEMSEIERQDEAMRDALRLCQAGNAEKAANVLAEALQDEEPQ